MAKTIKAPDGSGMLPRIGIPIPTKVLGEDDSCQADPEGKKHCRVALEDIGQAAASQDITNDDWHQQLVG